MANSLWTYRLYSPWNSPGQNTGIGSCSFLQGIFPIQGLNPGLQHCRQILYQLSHREAQEYWSSSLSLLQQIFLTQESNQGLLNCRRILYQLSYEGGPTPVSRSIHVAANGIIFLLPASSLLPVLGRGKKLKTDSNVECRARREPPGLHVEEVFLHSFFLMSAQGSSGIAAFRIIFS